MNLDDARLTGAEWLEADGQGGFASGTAAGPRTRRYQAILLVATTPPTGRVVLVNGFDAWAVLPGGPVALTSQHYAPDVLHPDGASRMATFAPDPWPTWTHALPDGSRVTTELMVSSGQTTLRWRREGAGPCRLLVRLLLSGRDYHALHHENPAFRFDATQQPGAVTWRPYPGLPPIAAWGGAFTAEPAWYRQFLYSAERDRGMDYIEDLAAPGRHEWDLSQPALLILRADTLPPDREATAKERPRRDAIGPGARAVEQYLAARGSGQTIIAGYPWFTDWGRDTFIALRGLLLCTGRRAEAMAILLAWSDLVSEGMLPNRFPDGAGPPEYNAVDASLWFVVAVHDLLAGGDVPTEAKSRLQAAALAIVAGYAAGTRFGIGVDVDGLLRAGEHGVQLTWMDAKVGDWVVTPRMGKPVEVQALWINALAIVGAWPGGARWHGAEATARDAFLHRFPDPATGGLRDTVDPDDGGIRPNQVFAAGGLPFPVVPIDLARGVVDLIEARLLVPLGLRTLDPGDPAYCPRYAGGVLARDGAYHQGTAWPWLLAPFVAAWLHVRGDTESARNEARARFLPPLHAHLHTAGLGHVSEVVDGDPPHTPGGCPFQAWSLGALLQIERMVAPA